MIKKLEECQTIVNRLESADYAGENSDVLMMMDLNNLSSYLQQIKDNYEDIIDASDALHSLSKSSK